MNHCQCGNLKPVEAVICNECYLDWQVSAALRTAEHNHTHPNEG
jgi:hypothetical protein